MISKRTLKKNVSIYGGGGLYSGGKNTLRIGRRIFGWAYTRGAYIRDYTVILRLKTNYIWE